MTAVTDFTDICTILKGSVPTNAQIAKVAALYRDYLTTDTPTNEQRAQAALTGMRQEIRQRLRANAESAVYAQTLRQAHYPADQPALLAAAQPTATAAGDAAEADL